MEFKEAVSFLYSLIDYEKKKGYVESLDPFREFLSQFDNPHLKIKKPILIVGTKGKGSTAHLIATGLNSLGFKVGLYTSPHLVDIRERIKINGLKIPEEKFAYYMDLIRPYLEGKRGIRTVFETLTLMAFLYFLEENVDYAVLEAGLGGRLDATNVVNQILTVITNVSYDHMEILGNKLTQIAWEKGMVIKNKSPVACSSQHPSVYKVLSKIAQEHKAPFYPLPRNARFRVLDDSLDHLTISYKGLYDEKIFTIPQGGNFQAKNIALSALALEVLGFQNFSFENFKIEGRFEILSQRPLVIIDGAHNVASVRALLQAVKRTVGKDITFVFGINADKEVKKVVKEISKFNPKNIILTRSQSPRAEKPESLAELFKKYGKKEVFVEGNAVEALKKALLLGDKILVFGSFYLAGEIKEFYNSHNTGL